MALTPNFKSIIQEKVSEAKERFQKTEGELRRLFSDLTEKPQQTMEESKELVRGYADWVRSKTENLEQFIEKTVRHAVQSFSPIEKHRQEIEQLEKRVSQLNSKIDQLKEKPPKSSPTTQS